ncbi:amidophosphoribosyltransferase [bacterium]|nr:amidophosphoribosyltransferase [bacterium]
MCGIFGVFGSPKNEAAKWTYYGLYAQQHRGQESAGIVSSDGENVFSHFKMGLVSDVFKKPSSIENLKGSLAIGHNRYSTTGTSNEFNIQPLLVKTRFGSLSIAHNGNLVNTIELRQKLEEQGSIFRTSTDSEVIVHLIAKSQKATLEERVIEALLQVKGAYSLLIMSENQLIVARDPNGFKPLSYGRKDKSIVFASESCAFDLIDAEFVREVEPGEIIVVDVNGIKARKFADEVKKTFCIFELIYFSRPDSRVFGEFVDKVRRKFGKFLAIENNSVSDVVISVPDSSNTAALGYASTAKIKFEIGLIRNHYIGRTFIHPDQNMRDLGVKLKFNTVGGVLKDRRVTIVDDSIVRGTTLKKLAKLLRNAGAREVHVRISSPPVRFPCFYGMDFPTSKELVANQMTIKEMTAWLDVDSLSYLSIENTLEAAKISLQNSNGEFCDACFTGNYPENVPPNEKNIFQKC